MEISCAIPMEFTRSLTVADLKPIYAAATENDGIEALGDFANKWDSQYSYIAKSWYSNCDNLAVFFQYPPESEKLFTQLMLLSS